MKEIIELFEKTIFEKRIKNTIFEKTIFEKTIKDRAFELLTCLLDSYKALKTVANSKNQQEVVCLSKDQIDQIHRTRKTIEQELINTLKEYTVTLAVELEFLRLHNKVLNEDEKKWIEEKLEFLRDILKDLVELKKQ